MFLYIAGSLQKLLDAFLMNHIYYKIQDFVFYQQGSWVGSNKRYDS
jgi:hypothetical protein